MRMGRFILVGLLSGSACAVPVASNLIAQGQSVGFVGQSFTVLSAGPVDHIVFNFFSDVASTTPSALGNGYLFSAPYLGLIGDIGSATLNLLGSTTASSNHWTFDPALVLQPNTQYFFYSDTFQVISGANPDVYPGGDPFFVGVPPGTGPYIPNFTSDYTFLVDGTLAATGVPEVDARAARLPLASVFCLVALALSSGLSRRTRAD